MFTSKVKKRASKSLDLAQCPNPFSLKNVQPQAEQIISLKALDLGETPSLQHMDDVQTQAAFLEGQLERGLRKFKH